MTRGPDPERLDRIRRAGIQSRLVAGGMDPGVAERWCDAWTAEAALRDVKRDGDYWDAGGRWINTQCAARKQPPS